MATIEERAREYSLKDFDGYYSGWEKDVEEGYIAGATEQKALDIENAKMLLIRLVDGCLPILLASLGITNSLKIL